MSCVRGKRSHRCNALAALLYLHKNPPYSHEQGGSGNLIFFFRLHVLACGCKGRTILCSRGIKSKLFCIFGAKNV